MAVVVPNLNLSDASTHTRAALSPVEPRSKINPKSFALLDAPVFNSIRLSAITELVEEIVVVAP